MSSASSPSTAKTQACTPCAKRKVKCDRGEPCLNCRRRRTDQCTYPEVSPHERIKKLEDLVRNLGGDPNQSGQLGGEQYDPGAFPMLKKPRVDESRNFPRFDDPRYENDPALVKEEESPVYVETYVDSLKHDLPR